MGVRKKHGAYIYLLNTCNAYSQIQTSCFDKILKIASLTSGLNKIKIWKSSIIRY